MLSNLFREEVENLVPKISKIFNLKIGLPDEKTSEVIAEELAGELLANLIFWYYNQTGVTIVRNMIIKDIDPVAHPYFGGLVLIEA